MNYENEIDKILESIKNTNNTIKPLNMVIQERISIIENAFQKYMHYENNIKNKPNVLEELDEYQYVPYNELQVGDHIRELLVSPFFFNIRLSNKNKVYSIKKGVICLRNDCKRKHKKQNAFFKKISKDEMVKMKLMDLIHES
jgi:hypothetical protein